MTTKVLNRSEQSGCVILEKAESLIAALTEQLANRPRGVVVIDTVRFPESADSAQSTLNGPHPRPGIRTDAVRLQKVIAAAVYAVLVSAATVALSFALFDHWSAVVAALVLSTLGPAILALSIVSRTLLIAFALPVSRLRMSLKVPSLNFAEPLRMLLLVAALNLAYPLGVCLTIAALPLACLGSFVGRILILHRLVLSGGAKGPGVRSVAAPIACPLYPVKQAALPA